MAYDKRRNLLKKMTSGELDGFVGDDLTTSGGSSVWQVIKNGIPAMFKQCPGSRFFNGKENEHIEGAFHTLQEWVTDEQNQEFLRKFGWLMKDEVVRAYSAKFKPKRQLRGGYAMSRQRSSIVHEFYCTQCGERGIPVYRKYGQFRKVGHLKKLYCLPCGKETNHAECISASKYDSNMFFEEYKSGNFDSEGNRVLSLSE